MQCFTIRTKSILPLLHNERPFDANITIQRQLQEEMQEQRISQQLTQDMLVSIRQLLTSGDSIA